MFTKIVSRATGAILALTVIGCTFQLAPAPSNKILENSQSSMVEGLTLLESMKFGAPIGTFESRESSYAQLIAKLESVSTQIDIRLPPADLDSEVVQKAVKSVNSKVNVLDLNMALEKADYQASLNALREITYLQVVDKACSNLVKKADSTDTKDATPAPVYWVNAKGVKVEVNPVPKDGACPTVGHVELAKKGFSTGMKAVTFYEQLLVDLKGDK